MLTDHKNCSKMYLLVCEQQIVNAICMFTVQ